MKNYNNDLFKKILEQVMSKEQSAIEVHLTEEEFIFLQYYLTKCFYYTVIVDDYLFNIVDKNSLLEALYYQVRLVTMHDLNWDAFEEALFDTLNNFIDFDGICLFFKNDELKTKLPNDWVILMKIVEEINKNSKQKLIKIVICK